jgi:50S ribosomal protein L16 3-hydroxylase
MILEAVEAHHVEIGVGQIERRRRLPRLHEDAIFPFEQLHERASLDVYADCVNKPTAGQEARRATRPKPFYMKKSFLAGLSRRDFLRHHWQKKPMMARDALGDHAGAVTRDQLFELAGREGVESRIVTRARGRWQVRDGPFRRADIARLPQRGWTLLVQGVDLELPAAARLMREFAFLPYARLDDVMVSYAAPGGGVGPHFDSYDVFLVQGKGRRRWRVSAQNDLELVPQAPLRILRRFRAEHEWTLGPGDVLYLPPHYAHEGVALDGCITYSVGFRAPGAQELAEHFLDFLLDRLQLEGRYADPGLEPTRNPARIPPALTAWSARTLERLRWSQRDAAQFVGMSLSEPKPGVVFRRASQPLSAQRFARAARTRGLALAAATRMLYRDRDIFINGERVSAAAGVTRLLAKLADARELAPPFALDAANARLLYAWYLAGYISIKMQDAPAA